MTAATGEGRPGTLRLHRVARRYEPVLVTLAVCLGVMHLVDPIAFTPPGVLGIAPFTSAAAPVVDPGTDTPPGDAAGDGEGTPSTAVPTPATATGAGAGEPAAVAAPAPAAESVGPATAPAPSPPATAAAPPAAAVFAAHPGPGGAGGVATAGERVVASLADGGRGLAVFSAAGELQRSIPLRASGLTGLTARSRNQVVVAATEPASIHAVDVDRGVARRLATIPDVEPCVPLLRERTCDASPLDGAPRPWAVAVGPRGDLFVADAGQGSIWRVPADGGDAEQWLVDRTFVFLDGLSGPVGLAFDGAGDLVVVLPRRLTDDRGEVIVVDVTDDGDAGEQRTIAVLAAGERPAGMALGPDARVYLSLPTSRELLVLDGEGNEVTRIAVDAALAEGDLTGVALLGEDDVLVASRRVGAAAATAVVRITGVRA